MEARRLCSAPIYSPYLITPAGKVSGGGSFQLAMLGNDRLTTNNSRDDPNLLQTLMTPT